jgi:3-oxoacyl-[acyl-carrier-protein] synthase II
MGTVNPLGNNVKNSWSNIISGKSGISRVFHFPVDELPDSISKVAGQIKIEEGNPDAFDPNLFIDKKDQKKMDKFIWYSIAAAKEALDDAGWLPTEEKDLIETGVLIGAGIGGLKSIYDTSLVEHDKGIKKISPFFIPQSLINLATGHISIKYGFMGPNVSIVTACASSTHAIGEAMEYIKRGDAEVMVAGGAESTVCEVGIGGFSAMHALSTNFNDRPEEASRPWDKDRDGFVMGEGAGVLILEELEHAKKRGAKIYGEIIGYGLSGDAYHMTSPHAEGKGAKLAMKMALKKAEINSDEVGYVNAHGTSTPMGDVLEFNAVKEIFSNSLSNLCMSSTKSATGHLLGGAGAIEAVFSIKTITDGIIPPTLNLYNQDENCTGIDLVPFKAKEKSVDIALSNSFGFGGTNACLIFKKFK